MNLPPLNAKRIDVCGSTAWLWKADEGWVIAQGSLEIFSRTFNDEYRIRWGRMSTTGFEGGGTIIAKAPLTEEDFLRLATEMLEKFYDSQAAWKKKLPQESA